MNIENYIDNGWDICFENTAKRMDANDGKGRDWHIRVTWEASNDDKKLESKWEGFPTAKEAIKDLLNELSKVKIKKDTKNESIVEKIERLMV